MDSRDAEKAAPPAEQARDYEPPRVERVVDPVQLERESLYAGGASAHT